MPDEFVDWYCSEPRLAFNRIVVLRYRSHLESRQLSGHNQPTSWRRASPRIRSCGLPSSQRRFGCRYSSRQRGEEVGHSPRRQNKATRFGKPPIVSDSKENVTEPCSHCYSRVG